MLESQIVFNEPTVIDHSFIAGDGCIYGGSVNPSFIVSGSVDPTENVVLDFSSGKQQIKKWIDAERGGFDHKCWIIPGISGILSIDRADGTRVLDWNSLSSLTDNDELLTVTTTQIIITAPKSAFKIFTNAAGYSAVYQAATAEITDWLTFNMPEFTFEVQMLTNPATWTRGPYSLFRYVHGLKDSTSWGCQNIAHGHLSYIQIEAPKTTDVESVKNACASIARDLDNTVFVNAANFKSDLYQRTIQYTSTSRGKFSMSFHQTSAHKLVVLETETTIEHIVEFVAAKYSTLLKSLNATRLHVSEGLTKGAVLTLSFEE